MRFSPSPREEKFQFFWLETLQKRIRFIERYKSFPCSHLNRNRISKSVAIGVDFGICINPTSRLGQDYIKSLVESISLSVDVNGGWRNRID